LIVNIKTGLLSPVLDCTSCLSPDALWHGIWHRKGHDEVWPVNYPGPSGVASDAAQHVDLLRGSAHRACRSAGIFSTAWPPHTGHR